MQLQLSAGLCTVLCCDGLHRVMLQHAQRAAKTRLYDTRSNPAMMSGLRHASQCLPEEYNVLVDDARSQ